MAAVLVVERDPQVRELLLLQLRHLGHDALDGGASGEGPDAGADYDLVVLEPVDPNARLFGSVLAEVRQDLPILLLSIEGPTAETGALRPVAHLVKPVLLEELGRAVESALAANPGSAPARALRANGSRRTV